MPVSYYDLDQQVFRSLKPGINQLGQWKGKASGIADYVASWGIERFWAMSRSSRITGGAIAEDQNQEAQSYFTWAVARIVLCEVVGNNLKINSNMTTEAFQERFAQLNFNQQVLLVDLLMEIAQTIQFWTMRIEDAHGNPV